MTSKTCLSLNNICAGYGTSQVLFDVNMEIKIGETVSLMGRNGMGKTTLIKAVMGLLPIDKGVIYHFGEASKNKHPFDIARQGIGLVPEGRQIFPNLSVEENLTSFWRKGLAANNHYWNLDSVLDLFPQLVNRLHHSGNQLSGGEQQMLAIGRALMTNPQLLILDEATEGLAPMIRAQIWQCLADLKQSGQSILVIDKHIAALTQLADKHFIIEKGHIVWQGNSDQLIQDEGLKTRYLGVF